MTGPRGFRGENEASRGAAGDATDPAPGRVATHSPIHALVRWQHAAGPLWPYVAATPFLSATAAPAFENLRRLPPQGRGFLEALERTAPVESDPPALLRGSLQDRTAFFLDLPPLQTLSWALSLNRKGLLIVPVFHRWGAEGCHLPVTGLLRRLVACARHLRRPAHPSGAVFFLDSERSGPARIKKTVFDNRYRYGPHVFPTGAFLKEQGVTRGVLLSDGPPRQDLWPYLQELRAAGLPPEIREAG